MQLTIKIALVVASLSASAVAQTPSEAVSPAGDGLAVMYLSGPSRGPSSLASRNRLAVDSALRPNRLRIGGELIRAGTTHPAVHPGEPVSHLARPRARLKSIRRALAPAGAGRLPRLMREHLATNVVVHTEPD